MNDNIETFIERHGVEDLLALVPETRRYIEGQTNAGIVANKHGYDRVEAETILQELRLLWLGQASIDGDASLVSAD